MGIKSTLPVFISPAAMAKLGHPLGEVNLTKGAGECGIVQGVSFGTVLRGRFGGSCQISINASCSLDEIMSSRKDGQNVWFQVSPPTHTIHSIHQTPPVPPLTPDLPEQRPQSL